MKNFINKSVNFLNEYDSLISSFATVGSFLTAFISLIIAVMVFRYNKNKEALNLTLNFNRDEISMLYGINENDMYVIVNDLKIQIQNPSISSSNSLFFYFSKMKNRSMKELYNDCNNNSEFTFEGGDRITVKNLQNRSEYINQKVKNIENGESIELPLPHFIIEDLVQASYLSKSGNPFKYTQKVKIKVTFYHKQKHKLKSKNKVIKYDINYYGARQVLHLDMKPVFIHLFK
ncbi:hypothetical protein K2V58_00425 [Staphylococcus arlettae]|uniref:hypothetical protein n=1 Tax=Staphylococcus arlettae TaxID=29378 RepID=UPI001E46F322|nr:hypothetical protein [Staphylococcus arlettae]MCD8832771.1 hypothetical protein [Staphylococcus arlettae]